MGLLYVLALLMLLVGAARAWRRLPDERDRPARLLAIATRSLPSSRQAWGRAMRAELHQVGGRRERWRFSFGCARASALIRVESREPGGAVLRAVVLAGIPAAAALAVYGLVRYPSLRSDPHAWASLAGVLALVLAYGALAMALARGTAPGALAARRWGLAAGLLTGGAWYLVLAPPVALRAWVLVPLLVALLAPACAAVIAPRAALWSGVVGGLVAGVAWVVAAYVHDGRPYDVGLVRDFHTSGAHDLAAYAVSGDLATGLWLLFAIPFLALASAAAWRSSAGRRWRSPARPPGSERRPR